MPRRWPLAIPCLLFSLAACSEPAEDCPAGCAAGWRCEAGVCLQPCEQATDCDQAPSSCTDGWCRPCVPDCGARVCGPDPLCGVSCGDCSSGEVCRDGGCEPNQVLSVDVVVAGAGTGGTAAAIQAARLGARVALLEETDWVGGQATTAGVSTMDDSLAREWESGVYAEFIERVRADYAARGKSIGTCYWSAQSRCFEPAVGQRILRALLAEADAAGPGTLELFERTRVTAVLRDGLRVTGVRTADGRQFDAPVVIDATECGDLLPLAGVHYRAGNGTDAEPEPEACVQDITYTAPLKKYPSGVPSELQLLEEPPGTAEERPYFARIAAVGGTPWPAWPIAYPVDFVCHNAYRGLPDSSNPADYTAGGRTAAEGITKTQLNFANDYPAHAAYNPPPEGNPTLSVRYLEDRDFRRGVDCLAKLRTLQFIHYVQHDLGEPLWSVADDEGYDTPYNREERACPEIPEAFRDLERHFPPLPYVRESRRLVGLHTLSGPELVATGDPPVASALFVTALAMGGYPADLHNCRGDSNLEATLEDAGHISSSRRFQVPFGCFIPEQIDGLLPAEKNLSQSRLANGATRLQGITMLTGQAVGALAALAISRVQAPRAVPPVRVQDELVRAGVALSVYDYTDLPRSDPAWADVQLASTRGILLGPGGGVFGRDQALDRGQAAAFLVRLFELPLDPPATPSFQDVPAEHPFFAQIEAIRTAGYTSGCSLDPPLFCPDEPLARTQLAVFLAKGAGLDPDTAPATPIFDDVDAAHPMFRSIQAAAAAGLLVGCSDAPPLFCPDEPVLRVQAAGAARRTLLHLAP